MLGLDELDAVSVATPPYLHRQIVLAAVERGCHVLCEKPLALTSSEGEEMLAAAQATGVVHATNYDWRTSAGIAGLRRLLQEGYVGRLYHARLEWLSNYNADPGAPWTWRHSRALAGFGALGDMSHIVDDVSWHFGPVSRIGADLRTVVAQRRDEESGELRVNDVEDVATFVAVGAHGTQVTGQVSRCAAHTGYRSIECFGSEGMIRWTMPSIRDRSRTVLVGARLEDSELRDLSTDGPPPETSYDRFVSAIRDRTAEPLATFAEGIAALRLKEAMRQSSETGRFIEFQGRSTPEAPGV